MEIERMLYRRYKTSYADCETVLGSYDKATKTIEVMLPEGRKKKSGVRGQRYKYMEFTGVENATGRKVRCTIKATCRANAIKRLPKEYPSCTWDISRRIKDTYKTKNPAGVKRLPDTQYWI